MNPEREKPQFEQIPDDSKRGENILSTNLKREFSKQLAPELRQETARRLREARRRPQTFEEAKNFSGEFADQGIEKDLGKIKGKIIGGWFKTFEYKQLKVDLEKRLKSDREWHIRSAKVDFEKRFEEILRKSSLTVEEQEKYLSEETMIAMLLDDYLVLLKRLSGNFVSHVTRYGVREQTYLYHSAGKGEFFTAFTDVLKAKKLNSFFANFVENPLAYPNVRGYVEQCIKERGLRGEELVNHLLGFYSMGNMPADMDSVHVAVNNIAATNYGAERGYDFYFYFPAEFVAHNYYHHGRQEKEFQYREWAGYDQYNDMAVWNGSKGLPIDAGITCIRGDAMVDKETGSQYKIVDGKPITDENGTLVPAENAIQSQAFWENYFSSHPEQKPNKILYYTGSTFEPIGIGPRYDELFQKKRFGRETEIPGYQEKYKEIFNQFRNRMSELASTIEIEISTKGYVDRTPNF